MRQERRILLSAMLWIALAAIAALAVGYGVFWLPYHNPGKVGSPDLELLRRAHEAPAADTEPAEAYEWVDRQKKIVRIPVEDAMAIIVEKLPVRKQEAEK
jgi:hypothetical protein